jgi:uncharacterized membrane protein
MSRGVPLVPSVGADDRREDAVTTRSPADPGTDQRPGALPPADDGRAGAPGNGAGAPAGSRWLRWLPRYPWSGTLGALLFGCASLTPSLLPRGWLLQGLISGLTAAIGYGVAGGLAWFVRELTDRRPGPVLRRRAWSVLAVVGAVLVPGMLWAGQRWQAEIDRLMGLDEPGPASAAGVVVVAVLVFAAVIGLSRAVRRLTRWLTRLVGRLLPPRLARPLAVVAVGTLLVFLLNGVLFQGLVGAANSAFSVKDGGTEEGTVRPTAPQRSGSPASLVSWDSLGSQGRTFVGTGPSAAELSAFSGQPASTPVRVYAGLASAEDVGDRADLAVRDLERAGGFDRSALVVVTTTGTGWVDPAASNSLEYELGGDTAMVAMQYSYLPSWLSFLVDQVKARDAGRALFDAVYGAWAQRPAGERPRLYVFGESLGTFGGEAAFSGPADIVNRTDGVLWAGPPNFNELWRGLVADREPGSPEWLPVVDGGRTVRFADRPGDLDRLPPPWDPPRITYLQNASDPIVWWSPQLLFGRPDWLEGTRAPDVSPGMTWLPFVTFWQVTADLVFAVDVPDGHGHHYADDYVLGWAAVVQPDGWTAADTERLQQLIGRG